MVKIAWEKIKETWEATGNLSKHGLRFLHEKVHHGSSQKSPKTVIFPDTLLFLHFPWNLSTFSAESPIPNAQKKHLFKQLCVEKGPDPRNTRYLLDKKCDHAVVRTMDGDYFSVSRFPTGKIDVHPKVLGGPLPYTEFSSPKFGQRLSPSKTSEPCCFHLDDGR